MFPIHRIKGYAWIVVTLSAFLLFYKYIMQVYPGIITNDIRTSFHISATQAGALVGVTFWAIVITQLFSGILLDRFGFRLISALSLVVTSLGLLLFIWAAIDGNLAFGYISRIMIGIGIAFATVSYIKAISVWFTPRQFAFASSFLMSAAMIGAIAGQAPLALLVKSTGSWHTGLTICALGGLGVAVIYWLVVRDQNPDKPLTQAQNENKFDTTALKSVLTNRNNWLLMLYAGLSFTTIDAFAGLWGNNYFREAYDISVQHAAGVISMIFLGMAIGAPIVGKISERLDQRLPLMIGFHFIATIMLSLVLLMRLPLWLVSICLFIFGFCLGIYMLAFAIGRRINPIWVTATVAALINTGEPVFGALFDPLIGFFLDLNWSGQYLDAHGHIIAHVSGHTSTAGLIKHFNINAYHQAFIVLVASMVISLLLLFFIRDQQPDQGAQ